MFKTDFCFLPGSQETKAWTILAGWIFPWMRLLHCTIL